MLAAIIFFFFHFTSSASAETLDSASAETLGEPVVFPDFSNLNEPADHRASSEKKLATTCRRNDHTFDVTDVMYASCMAENETDRNLQPSRIKSLGKTRGTTTGGESSPF